MPKPMKSWLWPDHAIGKRESRQLREEHNALVNIAADLLKALERGAVIPDGNYAGRWMCEPNLVRDALAKATGGPDA